MTYRHALGYIRHYYCCFSGVEYVNRYCRRKSVKMSSPSPGKRRMDTDVVKLYLFEIRYDIYQTIIAFWKCFLGTNICGSARFVRLVSACFWCVGALFTNLSPTENRLNVKAQVAVLFVLISFLADCAYWIQSISIKSRLFIISFCWQWWPDLQRAETLACAV